MICLCEYVVLCVLQFMLLSLFYCASRLRVAIESKKVRWWHCVKVILFYACIGEWMCKPVGSTKRTKNISPSGPFLYPQIESNVFMCVHGMNICVLIMLTGEERNSSKRTKKVSPSGPFLLAAIESNICTAEPSLCFPSTVRPIPITSKSRVARNFPRRFSRP